MPQGKDRMYINDRIPSRKLQEHIIPDDIEFYVLNSI